jgi:hypothetical protein
VAKSWYIDEAWIRQEIWVKTNDTHNISILLLFRSGSLLCSFFGFSLFFLLSLGLLLQFALRGTFVFSGLPKSDGAELRNDREDK